MRHSKSASAGNRTRVTSMATMYSTTRPLMLMPLKGSRDTMVQEQGEASRNRRPTFERRAAACSGKQRRATAGSGRQRRAKSAPARPARPSPFGFFAFSIDNLQWIMLSVARLAQSAERKALNLVVVGSSPTVGVLCGPPNPSILPS